MSLNLATRPFVNRRPIRRGGYFLWVLGLLLAVLNGFLYWDYLSGQGATESGLQGVIGELEEESRLLELARQGLEGFDTEELNQKIEFVNLRIQQRTFSWSRLFDVFAETLPGDIRLSSLTPKFRDRLGRAGSNLESDEVQLEISGEAKSSEALLEFLDRLFAHSAFDDLDLHREQVSAEEGVIDFAVSTRYSASAAGSAVAAGSAGSEASAGSAAGQEATE